MWHQWIEDKLSRNWSYDKIVKGFLTATSLDGRTRDGLMHEITTLKEKFKESSQFDDDRLYAQRNTIDLYWLKYPNRNHETMANQTASAFLGIRLQCAQCHKHPFDRWTQEDFRLFASFFRLVRYADPETGNWPREIKRARDYGNEELQNKPGGRGNGTDGWKRYLDENPPKLLGGETFVWTEDGPDLRLELWKWMRSPDNEYFAPRWSIASGRITSAWDSSNRSPT